MVIVGNNGLRGNCIVIQFITQWIKSLKQIEYLSEFLSHINYLHC